MFVLSMFIEYKFSSGSWGTEYTATYFVVMRVTKLILIVREYNCIKCNVLRQYAKLLGVTQPRVISI